MEKRLGVALGIAIAFTGYTPFAMYVFDVSLSEMATRAYFFITGACVTASD